MTDRATPIEAPGGRRRSVFVGALVAALALLTVPGTAQGGTFLRGFAEPHFASGDAADRGFWLDQSVRANSSLVRLNLPWRAITGGEPASPTDPADPAYNFATVDRAAIDATLRGQRILLTIYDAPAFAQGADPNSAAPAGTWKPDPEALGEFAEAVATRYSGAFIPPGGAGALPRAGYLEAWNESNLSEYLTPQFTKRKPFAPDHYREMLNAFYEGVRRSDNPQAKVVIGGSGPYGDPIGGRRTRPLRFLRELFCLNGQLEADRCKNEAKFDILAHHPITLSGGPNRSAIHPDDAAMPDFKNVVATLRTAERRNTVRGPGRHAVWATEFWWESNPPDSTQGVPVKRHARWIEESLYSLWKQGASAAIWLLLRDLEVGDDGYSGQQSGLFYFNRTEKPSFTAFRFPFVADRTSRKKVNVWTIPPASGTLEIQEERGGGFRTIDRMDVTDGKPDQKKIKLSADAKLRGVIAGESSLSYGVR